MKINPYLNFDGQTEEAFNYYKSVFGGEFMALMKMGEAPEAEKLSKEEQNRVMHVSLPIGQDTILMGSDTMPSMGQTLKIGNNNYISLHPDTREEADRLFDALSKDGNIEMPMEDQFWGDYFGSFSDKYGVNWMINYNAENKG